MPIGISVTTSEVAQSGGVPTTTGTAFFVVNADGGSATTPTLCRSISDFVSAFSTTYAPRTPTNAIGYDTVDTFFREGGQQCYVLPARSGSEAAASLALQDAGPHPTVVVTSKNPGVAGNSYNVVVTTGTSATFTANTTSASPNLASISSVANIGPGTAVTGTGIPAGTYILSVNTGANTAIMSANATATASGVTITPGTFTVQLVDPSGNLLETHGPFINTAALYADVSSTLVTFAQSAGGGFTVNSPVAVTQTALTGGANGSPTDANAVSALASFSANLGPGTVALPGRTSTAAWTGLLAHAAASLNNRWAALDVADSAQASTLISAVGTTGTGTNATYGAFFTSTCTIPGLTAGTSRTVPASAVVAGLRAQVAATGNDNQAPAGRNWPLRYVTGFTNTFNTTDTNSLNAAGINTFANRGGTLCLFGFVTPVAQTSDPIFWQASASCERMALIAGAQALAEPFLFAVLDGQQLTRTHFEGQLRGLIAQHWAANALYGANATDAGSVNLDPPVNTPATAQAGQLNAQLQVRVSPFAQQVNIAMQFVPVTQTVTQTG